MDGSQTSASGEGMTHRERVLAAIDHRQPDRVPFDYWAVSEVTDRLCRELGIAGKEGLLEHFGVDLRYVPGPSFVGLERRSFEGGVSEDLWGVKRKRIEVKTDRFTWSYKHVVESPLAGAETVADIERYPGWPSPDWWDYSTIADQCEQVGGYAVVNHGDRLDRTAQLKTMMYLRGMEQIYVDLARNPALIDAMLERIRAYYLEYNERVFRQIQGKADIFMMGDDFGTQQGPMMSLATWRRFFREGFRRYIELAHRYGLKVMHHSCGSVKYLMGELIDAGLDILQALQPRARDMDLAALKREYGEHLTFHGSIDIQQTLPLGTPADVEREVRERIQAAGGSGGFIIGTAHNLLPEVPTANILALYEACQRYGGG
ncbi:MAG: hypothetical protein JW797_08740 [Bradymonadales bacterium]|nr:hypothetical protein [Bradymonadales bacterium]